MGIFGGNPPEPIRAIGTAFAVWQPPYPTADDVVQALYARRHPPGSRWKLGRTVWLRIVQWHNSDGSYLFHPHIAFTGNEEELTLFGLPVDILDNNRDAFYIEEPDTATGGTERLSATCRECHADNPASAQYCILCGAPMAWEA